jgi:heat shock protein HtpX
MADWFRHWAWFAGGDSDNRDRGQLGIILFLAGIILSILAPIAAMLIQLAISRKREFLADASGALLTRYPEGLAIALEKISADPTPMTHVNRATAHLFIANPFRGKKVSNLFQTHPPIAERVKRLRGIDV